MADITSRDALIEELEDDGDLYFSGRFWSNIIDLSLIVLTVLASLIATVLAATARSSVSPWVVAGVAALPAAATSLQRIISIRERSNWYFMYAAHVRDLATETAASFRPTE